MVKAVFIDYMGTTVDEHTPEMAEIVGRFCRNGTFHDPKQIQRFILDTRRRYEADSYLDEYLTQDEIVERIISDAEEQIGLADDRSALVGLIRSHWVNALVFPDALTFFDRCPVPIYIITNIGLPYMEQALHRSGLKAASTAMGLWCIHRNQKYPLLPELRFANKLAVPGCVLGIGSAQLANRAMSRMALPSPPQGIKRCECQIPSEDGQPIRLTVYRPEGVDWALPCLVYFHGGGFCLGDSGYIHRYSQMAFDGRLW